MLCCATAALCSGLWILTAFFFSFYCRAFTALVSSLLSFFSFSSLALRLADTPAPRLLSPLVQKMVLVSSLNAALNSISNAERRGKRQVLLRPCSKVIVKFLQVMMKHGA